MSSIDKYRGALIGQAIGDALGAPVEGLKPGRISELYGRIEDYVDPLIAFKEKPYRWRMPGLYTDDTQQALLLGESLVRCRGFNAEDFSKSLLKMSLAGSELRDGAFRGIGTNFRRVLDKLKAGKRPFLCGEVSAGVGAGMRVCPLGMYFCEELEELRKASIEQGLVTHLDPRAIALSGAVAFCVAQGVSGRWDGSDKEERVQSLIEFIREFELYLEREYIAFFPVSVMDYFGLFSKAVSGFRYYVELELDSVLAQIVNEANRNFPREKVTGASVGFSLAGGICGLYLGIITKSFEEGVIEAVNLGRDSDSVGAITAAIAGARFGEESIVERWREGLKNYDGISFLADAIFFRDFSMLKERESIYSVELGLTRAEARERGKLIEKWMKEEGAKARVLKEKRQGNVLKARVKRDKKDKPRRQKAPWKTFDGF